MTPCSLSGAGRRHDARCPHPARHLAAPLCAFLAIALAAALLPADALAGPTDEDPPEGPQPITPVIGLQPLQLDFTGCIAIGSCVEKTFELFNNVDDPESILEITYIQISGAG